MKLSNRENRLVAEDEAFVTLIRVAQEDEEIKEQLLAILALDKFNRESALNSLIEDLHLKQAPRAFVSAIANLLDDDVADKTLEILRGQGPDTTG
jgi:hypothetical protein